MKQKRLTFLLLLVSNLFCASAQKWYKPEVDLEVEELLNQMTIEEKLGYTGGTGWMYTKSIDRLGIHRMRVSDGPQGIGTRGRSTMYSAIVTLAATWNENLAYQYGKALGYDCRVRNINAILGPMVNIYRTPVCGHNFEYMGEDPCLTSRICVGYIKDVQDQGVMATVEHLVVNNSDYNRNDISNDIDEGTLNEIYFPAYKAIIQEVRVGAIMTSCNLMNGIYTTENPWLLKEVLRNQWGLKGLVASGWGSTHYCVPATKSGLDLEVARGEKMNPKDMAYYLKTEDMTMDMVNEKVRHVLCTLVIFGFRDDTEADKSIALDDPQSVEAALNVVREGLIPLESENNILPINPQRYKHVIVTDENAHGYVCSSGSGAVVPFHYTSLLDGIQKEGKLNNVKVGYVNRLDFMPSVMYTDGNLNEKGFHARHFKSIHSEGAPVVKRIEEKTNYSWAAGAELGGMPKDYFSMKWYSTMCVDKTADYEFALGDDNGYKLLIDDQPIIDGWTPGGFRTTDVTKTLKIGGRYHVRVEYYQQGSGADICLSWKRKNETQNKFADYLSKVDLVITCFDHSSDTEGEASDRTFELPEIDRKIPVSLPGCKKPVIGTVNAGGDIEIQKWEPSLKRFIWGFHGGQEAGTAIGETLFGKVNSPGKLPTTFEKRWGDSPTYNSYHDPDKDKHVAYTEEISIGYRSYDGLKREIRHPFGYGLSYATFKLSDTVVLKPGADGTIKITYRLANTGKRDSAQIIQVYVGKTEDSPVERPQKELRRFEKVFLEVGESTTTKITLPKESFMYFNISRTQFVIDPGVCNIMLGFSSKDIRARKNIQCTLQIA